jgi:hypothetical protein
MHGLLGCVPPWHYSPASGSWRCSSVEDCRTDNRLHRPVELNERADQVRLGRFRSFCTNTLALAAASFRAPAMYCALFGCAGATHFHAPGLPSRRQPPNVLGGRALTAQAQDVGVSPLPSRRHDERPCGLDRHGW